MTAIEDVWELVVGVSKVVKAIFPQAHVLEVRKSLVKTLEPIGAGEGHQQHHSSHESHHSSEEKSIWNTILNVSV